MSIEAMKQALEPCPFCGAGTTEIRENGKMWSGRGWSEPSSVSVFHWCEEIKGQPSRAIERVGKDLDSAVKAWNLRQAIANEALNRMAENARELGIQMKRCDCAAHSAVECVCGAWDKPVAQQTEKQEPVAWIWEDGTITSDPDRADGTWTPLYTIPQPQRDWFGLTDEDKQDWIKATPWPLQPQHLMVLIEGIESELKEKNT